MKKLLLFTALLLPAALLFTACDKGAEKETPTTITVTGNQDLAPTVLADEIAPVAPVSFTTRAAWSSSIAETPAARSTRAASPDWISISPASGDRAGSYSVTISLGINSTGIDRTAVISILCDGEEINITVTQKAIDKDGKVPQSIDDNTLTYDGNTYAVTNTEFNAGVPQQLPEGNLAYHHAMRFYFSSDRYLEMVFVTDKAEFSGGAFKFGDIQTNPMGKAAGLIILPSAAGATGTADNLEWGPDLRAVRASDNTLTVEFNKVPTILGKEASFKFVGPFSNTSGSGFVEVQDIKFSATNALNAGTAALNTACSLSDAMVTPANSTNSNIEWSAQNATIEPGRITFDKAGTATVTATIRNGKLDDNGTQQVDYTQKWTVTVNNTSVSSVTWNSTNYPITNAEISAGVRDMTPDGYGTSFYRHDMKFYISSAQYVKLSFFTLDETLSTGEFTMVYPVNESIENPVTGQVNFVTATGDVHNIGQCNSPVTVVRRSDNILTVDFQGAYYDGGSGLGLHYEGEYKITDNGDPDPTPVDPDKMITFMGTDYPIAKAEHKVETWKSDDGRITAKCHLMTFYINSTLYAKVKIIADGDELSPGAYKISQKDSLGGSQIEFNFTTATGVVDYAVAGGSVPGSVRVTEIDPNGSMRVQFANITTKSANLPVELLYVGKFDETTTEPPKPALGWMTASETNSTYDLTGCDISFDRQTGLMRVEFTGKDCDLWFETYVNTANDPGFPMLNGTYTVDYLDVNGTDWEERFNNKATSARVHAIGNQIHWGDWSSGLREGTQIVVSMNNQKINASIQNAHINGTEEYQGSMLISLVYDGAYTLK